MKHMKMYLSPGIVLLLSGVVLNGISEVPRVDAGDWPMWRFDAGHTAAASSDLPDRLHLQWTAEYSPRKTVWDDPLNQDLMPYDRVFEPIVVGRTMLVGFNDSDRLVAIDTRTGAEKWSYYTGGPVRLPAAAANGKVYFVSDDGYLYCVRIDDGSLVWKFRGGPSDRKIIGNERLISSWPARGAPVLWGETVYFAASIWPLMGTFIYALDAETGKVEWINDGTGAQYIQQPHNYPAFAGIAPQGSLAATEERLIVPGGRSIPACFDRKTGRFLYFHLAQYGKFGGSSVFATRDAFFAHERDSVFNRYAADTGLQQENIRGRQPVLTPNAFFFSGNKIAKRLSAEPEKTVWETDVDATGDLIKVGQRLYAAGKNSITAVKLSTHGGPPETAWTLDVKGSVVRLLAADDRLFAVTLEGSIMAFAGRKPSGAPERIVQTTSETSPDVEAHRKAEAILKKTGVRNGYALVYGAGDGNLVEALAKHSELSIIAVDPDRGTVKRLRRRYQAAGRYGRRISLFSGDVSNFAAPPYLASLIVVTDKQAAKIAHNPLALQRLYQSLRPYGGTAWISHGVTKSAVLAKTVKSAGLSRSKLVVGEKFSLLSREGALDGAGVWTHQYGNAANTIKSDDTLVKLPLGILWFGGSSNMDVLPRHGHGPPEQVIGGRLFIEGMDSLSARDVYTGRVLWKTKLEGLDNFGVYYDETYDSYKKNPLTLDYNQVHIPGANARGTNFVATLDRVYVVAGNACRVLDSATGETLKVFSVSNAKEDGGASQWGYIGVYEDKLIAGVGFAEFSQNKKLDLPLDKSETSKSKWRFTDYDKTSSKELVVMDRITGKESWRVSARHSFIHNGIASANGMLYILDKLPPNLEARLARRGQRKPGTNRLLAIEIATGDVRWQKSENVFGTWLSCSEELNILLQSTRPSNDTVRNESGNRMIAYEASTGKVLWDHAIRYNTPPIMHGTNIITGGKMYDLRTGAVQYRQDPLTGERREWNYVSTKGCNYPIASENMITFRSSAAAFYDLLGDGGTGHFGGFKSGCTSNLVAADGVLNAPDYTRTCRCSFQNQTSLALVHMPDLEIWTHNDFEYDKNRVRRVGINFGAPGDRRSSAGTLWMDYPSVGGPSPNLQVRVEGSPEYFRHHSSRVSGSGLPWVSGSGVQGATKVTVRLVHDDSQDGAGGIGVADGNDDAEESASGDIDTGSSDLELTFDDSHQTVGVRFQKILVPRRARIKSAYIQFQTDETSSNPTSLKIHAEATDNASGFTSKKFGISSRPKSKQAVTWKPKAWTKAGAAGVDQRTPSLTAVLQEIVNRPGWKSGNSVAFLISGTGLRTAEAFDGDKKGAPKLFVELDESSVVKKPKKVVEPWPYTVRLHFAEPDESVAAGQRTFHVSLSGERVLTDFDVMRETGAALRSVVKEFRSIAIAEELVVTLTPTAERPAILAGIEIIAE